ncbi:MAG: hypothetical protein Q9194_002577 [Teloschistes cf. exilis]
MKRIASLFRKGPGRGRHEEIKGKAELEGPIHLSVPTDMSTSAYETPDDLGGVCPVELSAGDWTPTLRSPGPSTSPSTRETEALQAELEALDSGQAAQTPDDAFSYDLFLA